MKCDELEEEYLWTNNVKTPSTIMVRAYNADDVDKAIAELKDKCQMHDFFWEGCGFAKRGFKNTIAVSEAFDRLEAENAELKQKLEDAKASHYAEMVDAGMRERRLRRALWLAHAYKAKFKKLWLYLTLDCEMDRIRRDTETLNRIREKIGNCKKSERTCRAKAEEYK